MQSVTLKLQSGIVNYLDLDLDSTTKKIITQVLGQTLETARHERIVGRGGKKKQEFIDSNISGVGFCTPGYMYVHVCNCDWGKYLHVVYLGLQALLDLEDGYDTQTRQFNIGRMY